MALLLKLGGQTIKKPTEFTIDRYNITDAGRVVSGLMVMDLISKKRKFLFRYEAIRGDALEEILNIIDTETMFFTIDYSDNGVVKSAVCYTGAIHAPLNRSDNPGYWVWKDVSFDLIER